MEVSEWWHGEANVTERMYYLQFPREGAMPYHAGPHEKAQVLVKRQK